RALAQPLNRSEIRFGHNEKSRQPSRAAAQLRADSLLNDLVETLAGLGLRRFDLEALLLAGDGKEAAKAVGLPICGLHDFGEGSALGASDHLQDLRSLGFRARGGVLAFSLSGFLAGRRPL